MGRSVKDLRRSVAPLTGRPITSDAALLRTAAPADAPQSIAQEVKEQTQQLRRGYPKGPIR